jgi:hypothetical protein
LHSVDAFRELIPRYTPFVRDEYSLIAPFLRHDKADRYRDILATPGLRHKFTHQLAHFRDFDPVHRVRIPSDRFSARNIAVELRRRRAPDIVYAISEDLALDQKELLLAEALDQIVGRGMGTVLCCIPGELAFVETEDERFILERAAPEEKHHYIRFVIGRIHDASRVEEGIFHAAGDAVEQHQIVGSDADELRELEAWFDKNLKRPTHFGRHQHPSGICWFKTAATEHIRRIWEMVNILERNGTYVRNIRTDSPGHIIYEDNWQLVAEPPRKGKTPGR